MEKPTQTFKIGNFAKVHGLVHDKHLNDRYVEILTDLELKEVPDTDGNKLKKAWRYGVGVVTTPAISGFMEPTNLMHTDANRRSIWIHETGWEAPEDET